MLEIIAKLLLILIVIIHLIVHIVSLYLLYRLFSRADGLISLNGKLDKVVNHIQNYIT